MTVKAYGVGWHEAKRIVEDDGYNLGAPSNLEPADPPGPEDVFPYIGRYSQYVLDRGFDKAALDAYMIGFDALTGQSVFPVIDDGDIKGYARRSDGPGKPYRHNSGFNSSDHIFKPAARPRADPGEVYVCEGQLDAVAIYQTTGAYAVCTFGASLSEAQVKILKDYDAQIVLAYDNDMAGWQGTARAIRTARKHGLTSLAVLSYTSSDPGDFVKEDPDHEIVSAVRWLSAFRAEVPTHRTH